MTATRNQIEDALFAILSGIPGIQTASRRLKTWEEVPPAEQPALFMTKGDEDSSQPAAGSVNRSERDYEIYIYVHEPDKAITAARQINDILDALDAALEAPDGERQTLGGLVYHCWQDGKISIDEGALGEQGGAMFTIKILTYS